MIWFHADGAGSWSRLKIKLELNNLFFDGSLVPASVAALKDAVKDLVSTVRAQGLVIEDTPIKLSYTDLVLKLEMLGLIVHSGIQNPPPHDGAPPPGPPGPNNGPPAPPHVLGDGNLADAHHADVSYYIYLELITLLSLKVKEYISNQARLDVDNPEKPDALAQAVQQSDIVIEDFINPGGVVEEVPIDVDNEGLDFDPQNIKAPNATDTDIDGSTVMKRELVTAHETIAKLNGELARMRSKCLSLENQISSGKYFL